MRKQEQNIPRPDTKRELPKNQWELELLFARRLAELKGIPLAEAIAFHTQLVRKALGPTPEGIMTEDIKTRFLEVAHMIEVRAATEDLKTMLKAIRTQQPKKESHEAPTAQKYEQQFVRAEYDPATKNLDIHINEGSQGKTPLEAYRAGAEQLKEIFRQVKREHPDAQTVSAGSWLKLKSRMFPESFRANMREKANLNLMSGSAWGQFMNHEKQIRNPEILVQKIRDAQTPDELLSIFGPIYESRGAIEDFYDHLHIE